MFVVDNSVSYGKLTPYICVIDQACGQDGWILAKFFFFVFLWTSTSSWSIKTQKKNEAIIQPS